MITLAGCAIGGCGDDIGGIITLIVIYQTSVIIVFFFIK